MNYYSILGVEQDATPKEIQTAFRTLAKLHHPDANGNSKESEEKFKTIAVAYEVLSDEDKRRQYDAALANPGVPFMPNGQEIDVEELLKHYRHPDGSFKMPSSFKDAVAFGLLSLVNHLQKKQRRNQS